MGLFRKGVDIKLVYDRCMEGGTGQKLYATDVSAAHDSPFSLFCKYHVDPDKRDPPDPFLEALSAKGVEHEREVLESDYPGMERVRYATAEEGFMMALQSMAGGSKAISNHPLFYMPEGMAGRADVLERRDGRSVWGGHHYAVREIKVARNVKTAHLLQAAFYTLLLGRIQQRVPETFSVTNGDGRTAEYRYKDHEDLLQEAVEQAARIRGGWEPPAVYGHGAAPWVNHCNRTAVRNGDVSIIPGVGPGTRASLAAAGFGSVRDVSSSSAARLQEVRGIGGKKASAYLDSARALASGRPVRRGGPVSLPEAGTEVFLDLEGLNDVFDEGLSDYLIGALVRSGGREEYRPFVAEGRDEGAMLRGFLDFMGGLDDYVVYHWHHYERTHLKLLADRHGAGAHRILEPDAMVDLHRVATGAYAFPTPGNSIKEIAKWMGFRWRHDNVGATSSIQLYLEYAADPAANRGKMQMVLDYNEDDCAATRVVKDWLAGHGRG